MNKSQGQIMLLAGVLMVFALLLLFRHVSGRCSLYPS